MIAFSPNGRTPININTPVSVEFRNAGTVSESNVRLFSAITDSSGNLVYMDSLTVASWPSGRTLDTSFRDFTPAYNMRYFCVAYAKLPTDEYHADDTLRWGTRTTYETDMSTLEVIFPTQSDSLSQYTSFQVRATVKNLGSSDCYEFPLRTRILRQSDGALVFQADTIVEAVYVDSPAIVVRSPAQQGLYDTRRLLPGNYVAAVICRLPTDGDRTNDTAYSTFSVAPLILEHDIAVDSMLTKRNQEVDTGVPVTIAARFKNRGLSRETGFLVSATVLDRKGQTVYRDATTIAALAPDSVVNWHFESFTPHSIGTYTVRFRSQLLNDENSYDDTLSTPLFVGPSSDARMLTISTPADNATVPIELPIDVAGTIGWQGYRGQQRNIRVGALLFTSGRALAAEADTLLPWISLDTPVVAYQLRVNVNHSLEAGLYSMAVVIRTGDVNPANDTLWRTLHIIHGRDLELDSLFSPDSIERGARVFVRARFTNRGILAYDSAAILADIFQARDLRYEGFSAERNWAPGESRTVELPAFTPGEAGLYDLNLQWYDLASLSEIVQKKEMTFDYEPSSSVELPASAEIRVSPNPTTSVFTVSSADAVIERVQLFDAVGRLMNVDAEPSGATGCSVNVQHLPAGVYVLQITRYDHSVLRMHLVKR